MKALQLTLIATVLITAQLVYGQVQNSNQINNTAQQVVPGTCSGNYIGGSRDGNQSLGQTYNVSKCGLNYVQASQRLKKRGGNGWGVNQPAPFVISGLPVNACIEQAWVWSSTSGVQFPHNVTITNPNTVTNTYPMVTIGTGSDKCWGYGGTTSYRADVTGNIVGNGTYTISGLPTNPPQSSPRIDTDGATLFIVYTDPAATYEGHLVIHDGCQVGIGGNQASTITGINACAASSTATAFCMVGDWQLASPNGTWNGSFINFTWNWWNYDEVTTNVTNGQATAAYSMTGFNDCYNWVVEGLYYQTTTCTTCPNSNSLTSSSQTVDAQCGNCTGSATVIVTGGQTPYTYNWSNGQTTNPITGLCAGTYTVTVTDNSPCPLSTIITVTINATAGFTLTSTITDALCNGSCDGNATAIITGGSTPFAYNWSNGQTTNPATGLCAGTYTVTITDNNGCTNTITVTVNEPLVLNATITNSTNVLCNGDNNGDATVVASGGTSGYTYNWSNGQTNTTATGLGAGTYTVTVTDNNGCTQVATVTITEPPALIAAITSSTNILCNGANTGDATVTASGGTPTYTYSWSNGQTNATATGLGAGTYTVTVTDNNGCTQVATVIITEPPALVATLTSTTDVLCNGGNNGDATISVTGGTTPYTYLWSSGGTNATETGLGAGTYTVTITDNNGCTQTVTATITEPPLLVATITNSTNILCNGDNTGDATVSVTGGTTAYTYAWSSGGSSTTETGLGAGTYTITITDNNGCTTTATVTLTEPPAIVLNTTTTNSNCGQADGSATVTASGGVTPYTYLWSNGGTNTTETGLAAATYTVTVTDNNGCTQVITAAVTDQGGGTATAVVDLNVSCNGDCDGQATVSITGGTSPYTYLWSSGGTTTTETGLCAGVYTVTVTDNVGCIDIVSVTVTEPPLLVATINAFNDALCNGSADGDATVTATGGTTGYTYAWSSGGNSTLETGLAAGVYTVTVTDNNGCTATTTVTIGEPTPVVATISGSNDPLCNAGTDGDATASGSGGTSPYTYVWSTNGTSATETGIGAGTYTVTVTDDNGCTAITTVTISEPPVLGLGLFTTDIKCNGACDGTASGSVTGGTAPYTYNWSPNPGAGQGTQNASQMCANTYTFTITDNNGCSIDTTFVITEPPAIGSTVIFKDVSCPGDCDGMIDVSALGGTPPYTYAWGSGETTEDLSDLCVGTYNVTITDSEGCEEYANGSVNTAGVNPLADFTADPWETNLRDTEVDFYDNTEGNIVQWTWTYFDPEGNIVGGANEQNPTFTFPNQDTGTYCAELAVITDLGCVDDTTRCIHIEGIWQIFIPNAFTPNGDGINDYFFPQGIGINEQPFTFVIFDRWGEVIFLSNSLDQKWDGIAHAKGGTQTVKQDVYVWKLKVTDMVKNTNHEYIGSVTVVR